MRKWTFNRDCLARAAALVLCSILTWSSRTLAADLNDHAGDTFPPTFASVVKNYEPSERVLTDRRGIPIDEQRVELHVRRLDWTKLSDVSPAFRDALVRSEDRRFFEHSGVDWIALGAALVQMPFSKTHRGASTISMQLTQFLLEKRARSSHRSIEEKLDQIKAAIALEKAWSKNEILEAYLNFVTFRGEIQGLRAASLGLFAKDPHGLSRQEAAVLAVLIRAPNATVSKIAERACALEEADAETCHQISGVTEQVFTKNYEIVPSQRLAPVLAARYLSPGPIPSNGVQAKLPHEVRTTLDASLQKAATESLRTQLMTLRSQNMRDGAVIVLDNQTGETLAYVANGGIGFSSAPFVDGARARRQAGSTLKPFIYGLAFQRRLLTPSSLIDDTPSDFELEGHGSVYRPLNFDNKFHGDVTARQALGSSLNVPAVKTLMLSGESRVLETLRQFGFTELHDADQYGPSLALGTVDVSLWELTNAYRALANGGLMTNAKILPNEPKQIGRRALSMPASYLVANVLSDPAARELSFGFESPLATRHWTAVKTGTSKDMRDNWCVGFSRRYTVGVWVGNFSGQAMWNVSGVSGAAPIWLEVMNRLEGGLGLSQPPRAPKDIVRMTVGGNPEVFLRGTEPANGIVEIAELPAKIRYPSSGLIVAVDPDIPEDSQKIPFEVVSGEGLKLFLNQTEIVSDATSASESYLWQPKRGQQTLELKTASGKLVDQVTFEVR